MKDSLPNMDEVVRQIKHAVEMREKADIYENRKSTEWLRLLIEEREQLIAENERLKTCQSCGGQGFNVLNDDPYITQPCECVVFERVLEDYSKLQAKVAEQDKEIQHLRNALREISFGHDSAMHLQIIAEKALNQS